MFSLASMASRMMPQSDANPIFGMGGAGLPSLMSMPTAAKGILGGGLMAAPDLLGYNDLSHPFGSKSPLNLFSPPLFLANLFK